MCLIAFSWQPGDATPLRLIANRDELHARPAAPLATWSDAPHLVGGRDLEAGGTWLAVNRNGRIAALTNVRDPSLIMPATTPSRGALVREALEHPHLKQWLHELADGAALQYAGFNLLVREANQLWHLYRGRERTHLSRVTPGIHGLSNADLDTAWPKLIRARQALSRDNVSGWPCASLDAMHDVRTASPQALPDTGVGKELELRLSAAFILGEVYGTRATTWLSLTADGKLSISEQRFAEQGRANGETHLELQVPA
ncbi:NRDE family protein [Halomonas sp. Bachu 37]|uniref:NRDE family protein n=1 Tax=Halomonas kashgarensis TaxID=3084920 RepID=UPI003216DC60